MGRTRSLQLLVGCYDLLLLDSGIVSSCNYNLASLQTNTQLISKHQEHVLQTKSKSVTVYEYTYAPNETPTAKSGASGYLPLM